MLAIDEPLLSTTPVVATTAALDAAFSPERAAVDLGAAVVDDVVVRDARAGGVGRHTSARRSACAWSAAAGQVTGISAGTTPRRYSSSVMSLTTLTTDLVVAGRSRRTPR